uniref:non-specific serine/threonine protein kinase n=1 Tax=Amphilophus citrinellus TaxID=61819 RepID=A0A3Q0SRB0_AMPCI
MYELLSNDVPFVFSTSAVSSTEILKGCSDEKEKEWKRKPTGDGKVSPTEKKKRLDQEKTQTEQRRNPLQSNGKYATLKSIIHHCTVERLFLIIHFVAMFQDENTTQISVEVAAMRKLSAGTPGSGGTSAAVSLLDWFDLHQELILVMERPVPAVNLEDYIQENGSSLTEDTAKVILKQLTEAAKELEDKNIFHRDIKTENILIETGSDVPRVRLIDFGLSCFFTKRSGYCVFFGTPCFCPPEWLTHNYYRPGPTTVWQLGTVLYAALHAEVSFETQMLLENNLNINKELSEHCLHFLKMCLKLDPKRRPTLEDLLLHPWLR